MKQTSPPKKGHKCPFTVEEDNALFQIVVQLGAKNWNLISSKMNSRTPKQCRERWHSFLDPSINRGPWTPEEDSILEEKHKEFGNRWADIARFLPGRTDTLVKNRWNTYIKNRPQIIKAVQSSPAKLEWLSQITADIMPTRVDFTQIPPLYPKPKTPSN